MRRTDRTPQRPRDEAQHRDWTFRGRCLYFFIAAKTFSGLAGLGDLVLTCTGSLSRNRRAGEALARGESAAQIEAGQPTIAEGVRNSRTVLALARRRGIEMPITEQMEQLLFHGKDPRRAVEELMTRDLKAET